MTALVNARLLAEVFVTLVVIMDPLGTLPVFLALTATADRRSRIVAARQAVAGAPRLLGRNGISLVTRISGLLLSAIAVQLVADAVRAFVTAG